VSKTIEFFFDFGSPYSYLAHTQLPAMAAEAGATISYCPVGILRLMELSGNRPTTLECKNKRRYAAADLGRWANLYGVPMGRNSHLREMKLEPLLQGVLSAETMGVAEQYVSAVFKGIYADTLDLGDPAVFVQVLTDAGLDGKAILEARESAKLASDIMKRTENAVERGVFGAPTFIVDGQIYFGNDRLQFVKAALAA